MRRLSALIILATAATATAAARAPDTDFAARILAVHNKERAALGLPPLTWNESLVPGARDWAEHLARLGRLEHSGGEAYGENLWIGTAGAYALEQMPGDWAAEKRDFKPGVFPDLSRSGNWHAVGHYTQMIWRRTTSVGCALASSAAWDVLVCRYDPPGNWVGEAPY